VGGGTGIIVENGKLREKVGPPKKRPTWQSVWGARKYEGLQKGKNEREVTKSET